MRTTPLFTCLRSASCAVITMASVLAAPPREQPNIVFILADDLGYTDLSCMGSHYYETPNIDRLAREGMQFTNFHQAPNCAPSRACMMTGQYPPRTGIYTVGTLERGAADHRKMDVPQNVRNLPLDRQTIGDVLTAAGYRTGGRDCSAVSRARASRVHASGPLFGADGYLRGEQIGERGQGRAKGESQRTPAMGETGVAHAQFMTIRGRV